LATFSPLGGQGCGVLLGDWTGQTLNGEGMYVVPVGAFSGNFSLA
jgi:hypothetical protein